jgi:hypothetical protein
VLGLSGEVKPFEGDEESDVLDQGKIEAKHEDGVLRLYLPKVEKVIPR